MRELIIERIRWEGRHRILPPVHKMLSTLTDNELLSYYESVLKSRIEEDLRPRHEPHPIGEALSRREILLCDYD